MAPFTSLIGLYHFCILLSKIDCEEPTGSRDVLKGFRVLIVCFPFHEAEMGTGRSQIQKIICFFHLL